MSTPAPAPKMSSRVAAVDNKRVAKFIKRYKEYFEKLTPPIREVMIRHFHALANVTNMNPSIEEKAMAFFGLSQQQQSTAAVTSADDVVGTDPTIIGGIDSSTVEKKDSEVLDQLSILWRYETLQDVFQVQPSLDNYQSLPTSMVSSEKVNFKGLANTGKSTIMKQFY